MNFWNENAETWKEALFLLQLLWVLANTPTLFSSGGFRVTQKLLREEQDSIKKRKSPTKATQPTPPLMAKLLLSLSPSLSLSLSVLGSTFSSSASRLSFQKGPHHNPVALSVHVTRLLPVRVTSTVFTLLFE
jgi:hypothetical protein